MNKMLSEAVLAPQATGGALAFDLDVMAVAKRYNRSIARQITAVIGHADQVLDFGAGTGNIAEEVLAESGIVPTCIEPDLHFAATLRGKSFPVRYLHDLPEGEADALYSCNVLEHILNDVDALRMAVGKLRPGAPVFVYVPAFPILFGSWDEQVGHYRRYTRRSLHDTLHRSGVRVERTGYADSLGFMAAGVLKLVGRGMRVTEAKVRVYDRHLFPWSRRLDRVAHPLFGKNVWAIGSKS